MARSTRRADDHARGCLDAMRALVGGLLIASCAFWLLCPPTAAQEVVRFPAKGKVPPGYPAQYAALIAAAEQEGQLLIHSTTDLAIVAPVVEDFQALYPRVEVRYQDMNSSDLYNGYLDDLLTSPTTADVLWSSAMDLQLRIASAGEAQTYASPEISKVPEWAVWKNQAFGTTYEPIAIVYNKRLMAADEIPQTRGDFVRLLSDKHDRFVGKVVTYNIERSGLGFLLATQDAAASKDFWSLTKALGSVGTQVVATTEAMLARVGKGEDLLAYNALGSYASIEAKKDPSLGYVFPRDYTLIVTRVMLIGKKAANPNAARLWVDYLLSKRGQTMLANEAGLFAVRADVEGRDSAALTKALGSSARPILLGPELLTPFPDPAKRLAFVKEWQQAVGVKP
ncbi:MAG TPA: ABC transporter substrate-binding protein [Casimicrobiaceae bacterium]|nr:ABC transporter substrate-binding protein [Casimicrobiaceae bacterium]